VARCARSLGLRLATALGHDLTRKLHRGGSARFVNPWFAIALYIAVALTWLVLDRRIGATPAP